MRAEIEERRDWQRAFCGCLCPLFAALETLVLLNFRDGFCHEQSSSKTGVQEFFWKGRGETYFCKKWFPRTLIKPKTTFNQTHICPISDFYAFLS